MELNPYIKGALVAVIYLLTFNFLPKKLTGWKRTLVAIIVAIVISITIQLILDYIGGHE